MSHQIPIDQTQKGTQLINVQTERSNKFTDDANGKRSLSYEHHVQMLFDARRVSENLSRRAMNIDNDATREFAERDSWFTEKGQTQVELDEDSAKIVSDSYLKNAQNVSLLKNTIVEMKAMMKHNEKLEKDNTALKEEIKKIKQELNDQNQELIKQNQELIKQNEILKQALRDQSDKHRQEIERFESKLKELYQVIEELKEVHRLEIENLKQAQSDQINSPKQAVKELFVEFKERAVEFEKKNLV